MKRDKGKIPRKVSFWVKALVWALIIFTFIFTFYGEYSAQKAELGEVSAETLGMITSPILIGAIIAFLCAEKNSKWAAEINKSVNAAYLIGFFGSLLGLLGYWIYYEINLKKVNKAYGTASLGLKILLWLLFIGELFFITQKITSIFIGIVTMIAGVLIAFFCANKTIKWAKELNQSSLGIIWAYAVGLLGGFIGLFVYWIYYKTKRKRK